MSKQKTHAEIIDEIRLKCANAYWSEDSLHPNGDGVSYGWGVTSYDMAASD